MNWFRRMMTGRYGQMDQLNIFLFIIFLAVAVIRVILNLIGRFVFGVPLVSSIGYMALYIVYMVLFAIEMAVIVITILRMFSRNIPKRQQENQKSMNWKAGFKDRKAFNEKRKQARSEGKELFKCPTCKKQVRVPLGRGRIEITCPNCHEKFTRNT